MNTPKDETTHSDETEPIVSWSGVQGETQEETVEIPHQEEVLEEPQQTSSTAQSKKER